MLKKFILNNIIFKKRLELLNGKINLYNKLSDDEIIQYQLDSFNLIWKSAQTNNAFYKFWKKKYNLPTQIKSIDELKSFPELTKDDLQKNYDLIFKDIEDYSIISTGGSTGKPVKLPTSREEKEIEYANTYLGKSWWDIKPLDDIVMYWGHSHLFGNGIRGKLNKIKRKVSDWLINTIRFSAYDISTVTMEDYYQKIKKLNPKAIIGYSSVNYKISKYITENNLDVGNKSCLKGIICTSETCSDIDIKIIKEAFKKDVILEYGMAECGAIAYSKNKTDNIEMFWDSFIGTISENKILNITTLYARKFPLINYKTDDVIIEKRNIKNSLLSISKIEGRKNDVLKIFCNNNKIEVHSELFTHILKSIKGIINFKIIQKINSNIVIEYVLMDKEEKNIEDIFFIELSKELKNITKKYFKFKQVEDIPKTIAGKTKWVEIEVEK